MALTEITLAGSFPLHATATQLKSFPATEYGTDTPRMHAGRQMHFIKGLRPIINDEVVELDVYALEPMAHEVKRGSEFPARGVVTVKPVKGKYALGGLYIVEQIGEDKGGSHGA